MVVEPNFNISGGSRLSNRANATTYESPALFGHSLLSFRSPHVRYSWFSHGTFSIGRPQKTWPPHCTRYLTSSGYLEGSHSRQYFCHHHRRWLPWKNQTSLIFPPCRPPYIPFFLSSDIFWEKESTSPFSFLNGRTTLWLPPPSKILLRAPFSSQRQRQRWQSYRFIERFRDSNAASLILVKNRLLYF